VLEFDPFVAEKASIEMLKTPERIVMLELALGKVLDGEMVIDCITLELSAPLGISMIATKVKLLLTTLMFVFIELLNVTRYVMMLLVVFVEGRGVKFGSFKIEPFEF